MPIPPPLFLFVLKSFLRPFPLLFEHPEPTSPLPLPYTHSLLTHLVLTNERCFYCLLLFFGHWGIVKKWTNSRFIFVGEIICCSAGHVSERRRYYHSFIFLPSFSSPAPALTSALSCILHCEVHRLSHGLDYPPFFTFHLLLFTFNSFFLLYVHIYLYLFVSRQALVLVQLHYYSFPPFSFSCSSSNFLNFELFILNSILSIKLLRPPISYFLFSPFSPFILLFFFDRSERADDES